jgi:hypothetical protein
MMLTQQSQVRKCILKSKTFIYRERWLDPIREADQEYEGVEHPIEEPDSEYKRDRALLVKKLLNIFAPRALSQNE